MKKLFMAILVLSLFYGLTTAGEEPSITLVKKEPFTYAGMEFKGPYSTMKEKIGLFMQEFFKQGLTPTGTLISAYFNSPEDTKPKNLIWSVGFPVPASAVIKKPLKKITIAGFKAAVLIHKGPYNTVEKSYDRIFNYLQQNKLQLILPCYENYLNDPNQVKPEDIKTEIVIPLKSK